MRWIERIDADLFGFYPRWSALVRLIRGLLIRSLSRTPICKTSTESVPRAVASGALGAGRSLPLAVLTRRLDQDRHPGTLWPVVNNSLTDSAGQSEPVA